MSHVAGGGAEMSVSDAVTTRKSIRAFSSRPVDGQLVRRLVDTARLTPSGGNLQPWHVTVLAGEPLDRLRTLMREKLSAGLRSPEGAGYNIYPENLPEPYLTRRDRCTEMMYATMGIARADKAARIAFVKGNFQFWNAPVGMFFSIHRCMGPPQWSDLGMFVQTLMLLAGEAGLHTCPQEAWANWHATVEGYINLPSDRMLFCGLALGYADESQAVNGLRTDRAALEEIAEFRGL
jgi:nitroreductase